MKINKRKCRQASVMQEIFKENESISGVNCSSCRVFIIIFFFLLMSRALSLLIFFFASFFASEFMVFIQEAMRFFVSFARQVQYTIRKRIIVFFRVAMTLYQRKRDAKKTRSTFS